MLTNSDILNSVKVKGNESALSHLLNMCTGIYRELCLESVKNKYDCETQAAFQHWEVRYTDIIHYYQNNGVCLKAIYWSVDIAVVAYL